jgi:hypothetical protein
MEHIAALLLIIGCSNDLGECRELPAPTAVFETAEECTAELPDAYRRYGGVEEKLFARCIAVDPAMEEEDAELVWDVTGAGVLVATIETAPVMVATNSGRTDAARTDFQ